MQNHTSSKKVTLGIINIPGMIIYNIIISPAVRKELFCLYIIYGMYVAYNVLLQLQYASMYMCLWLQLHWSATSTLTATLL